MNKTILITGSTDGIGLETAKAVAKQGHTIILHGRSQSKLDAAKQAVLSCTESRNVYAYLADLADLQAVADLADLIATDHPKIDGLINNAGVLKTPNTLTSQGFDVRFVVNTLAPFILFKRLSGNMNIDSRVLNLSSAAQAPVSEAALLGQRVISEDFQAYAQSKLALTMWSIHYASLAGNGGPIIIPVNPGSLLATKMVREGFNTAGNDVSVGVKALMHLLFDEDQRANNGCYFDNDVGAFAQPHPDALSTDKNRAISNIIERLCEPYI